MTDAFYPSALLMVVITLGAYAFGTFVQKHLRYTLFNPLLIATVLMIVFLRLAGIEHGDYARDVSWITALLGPTIVALAIPLNRQFDLLMRNKAAILAGVAAGTAASLLSVIVLSVAAGLPHELMLSLLPKSITTAIAVEITEKIGGIPSITSAALAFTGIGGAILARPLARLLRITEPMAHGLAIGTSAHAMGTSKAVEISELTGAISSLALVLAGVLTVIVIPLILPLLS